MWHVNTASPWYMLSHLRKGARRQPHALEIMLAAAASPCLISGQRDSAYMLDVYASCTGIFSVLLDSTDCVASATDLEAAGADVLLVTKGVSTANVSAISTESIITCLSLVTTSD